MKFEIEENEDFEAKVFLDEKLIWNDEWAISQPEDMLWRRRIRQIFEAGRKLGFAEGRNAYQYPRDALDL